jgi:hypothetical protein
LILVSQCDNPRYKLNSRITTYLTNNVKLVTGLTVIDLEVVALKGDLVVTRAAAEVQAIAAIGRRSHADLTERRVKKKANDIF